MSELQTRRRVHEVAVSGLVALVLLIGVVWNLPSSPIQQTIAAGLQPVALGTGLDQRWQMYAPDPIRRIETVEVHVTMADGGDRMWTNPRGDPVIGPFTWYRWQKLKENLVRQPAIRADVAHWVVRELTRPGEVVQRVQMILRTEDLMPPGHDAPGAIGTETLYDEHLAGRP